MTHPLALEDEQKRSMRIKVRGQVQGVGFRPFVWRLAHELNLNGEVYNDASGVVINAVGHADDIDQLLSRLREETPPLSLIDRIDSEETNEFSYSEGFCIAASQDGAVDTLVAADAAVCDACLEETLSPFERRFRYPFTNCTHCGPRFSITKSLPYDRANTSMDPFVLCDECRAEFETPQDRRFHAQPVACHVCGPQAKLIYLNEGTVTYDMHSMLDDVDAVCSLLQKGEIVAIKGIGGFHLATDATNETAVKTLRSRKHRDGKPFALMARDLDVIRQYAFVSTEEEALLTSAEAPIVLLKTRCSASLAPSVAPGLSVLGFMLPYTPLHHLILRRMQRPVVMTSANLTDEPQITQNEDVTDKLRGIADYALIHNREIVNRVDDSVVKVYGGSARVMRRARGYAPGAVALPEGFDEAPEILAYGGELKASYCLLKSQNAILSQHIGDLEDALTFEDYQKSIGLYENLFDHQAELLAADLHPEYLSSKIALERSKADKIPIIPVQHHHAHIAAVMAESGMPLNTDPVLGIVLDGLGFGDDGTIWGGEFMLANYQGYQRLGCFKPVPMIGGAKAIQEPWRNTYAHLMAEMGWSRFAMNFQELDLFSFLERQPREVIDQMLERGTNVPLASSCGRLFDAVAAALGLAREVATFEGEGAMLLESIVDEETLNASDEESAYPFAIPNLKSNGLPYIEPLAMWQALLGDLILQTPAPIIAARFHKGLVKILAMMVDRLTGRLEQEGVGVKDLVLTGGCFQNAILFELLKKRLEEQGFQVHSGKMVPVNDGGLAFGQVAVAAARYIETRRG